MTLPAPVPFAAFGTVWYGGLVCGLCRALAAPWLNPWWLTRETQGERLRETQGERLRARERAAVRAAPATQPPPSPPPAPRGLPDLPARGATIIPFDLARARAAGRKAADRRG